MTGDDNTRIAVIGMAGRFPMAPDVERFWAACRDGTGCISHWQGMESKGRVLAGGLLAGQEFFDPEAFGISPAEATILDPQHRVFLELCWQGLADAAIVPDRATPVSVYAAAAPSRYRPAGADANDENDRYQRMIANGPDYLATRASYHLDLSGEAVNVQTACSSSLVAVHLACLSLQSGRSDVALAGGVSIDPEQERGYRFQAGMIASPDGMCLPFDTDARGAVPGNGAALVVLQRLSDAVAQRRRIHAVILATATNNDGRGKPSFMAPNAEGQSEAIATALATAGIPPDTIGYLETHGTATRLGDSIEIEAARTAFRYFTDRRAFCALGSLKANFGHLDRAAGAAGLIKAILAVREGVIPPLLGLKTVNPDLELETSPFRIPTRAEPWQPAPPRRAGVSSFGVGGTNAHVIVEAFRPPDPQDTPAAVAARTIALPLSAHNGEALADSVCRLAAFFDGGPNALDVAHTLGAGRVALPVRTVVVTTAEAASAALRNSPPISPATPSSRSLAMLFPGQGAEVGYRAGALADRYDVFRDEIDRFAQALDLSTAQLLSGVSGAAPEYREFAYQPALVAVQVALARLAEQLGVSAAAYCGNSLGEYAAAYLAGVFDRRGLMTVLAARDRAMRAAPEGRMLAVLASATAIEPLQLPEVDFAGENWRDRVLLSGPPDAIARQRAILEAEGIVAWVLPGRIGPHGRLMAHVAGEFRQAFRDIRLAPASHPMVSTLTGDWISPSQLADADHWIRHLCEPFRFQQAFNALQGSGTDRFVEASPGVALTKIIRASGLPSVATSLGGETDGEPVTAFLSSLGVLWCAGSPIHWDAANGAGDAHFVTLPPFPFQRRRFWSHQEAERDDGRAVNRGFLEHAVWQPRPDGEAKGGRPPTHPVIVHGQNRFADALIGRLAEMGVAVVRSDSADPQLVAAGTVLIDVSNAVNAQPPAFEPVDTATLAEWLDHGFLRSIAAIERLHPPRLLIVTRGLWAVIPSDRPVTACAGAIGIARCAPHDWPGMRARIIDLPITEDGGDVPAIVAELGAIEDEDAAYRGGIRYRRRYEALQPGASKRLRAGGTYLVLGGTGRLGAVVAEAISREVEATIVLVGREIDRKPSGDAERLIAIATARGCTVLHHAARCDDPQQLRGLLDAYSERTRGVGGIFHLAANTDTEAFQLLGETTAVSAIAITQAKVCTAALLARLLADRDYDFVALFSSISTVIGAARFGSYVAANAYLDALAVTMRAKTGRTWLSLVWDGWAANGVAGPNALGFDNGAALLLQALRTEDALVASVMQPLEARCAAVLADLAIVARTRREAPAPESGTTAERIVSIIAEVTGHDGIDPKQKFASLGIDSLRMMQIVVRLQPLLGKGAGIGKLLAATSLEELTTLAATAEATTQRTPRRQKGAEDALSTPQQRLWYLTQLDPVSSGYNVPFGWRIPAQLGQGARAAVDSILERHEMLRAAYRGDADGEARRITLQLSQIPIHEIALESDDPEGSFARIVRPFVEAPFDLAAGSTRVLIAVGPDATRLVLVCHHLSIDAWSIKLLRDELLHRLRDRQSPISAPPARYGDFVQCEREQREGPEYERLAEYWEEAVGDARPTIPDPDDDVVPTGEHPVGHAIAVLDSAKLAALRSVLREQGATLYAAGITALSIALCHWCGQREVMIGTNLANRMHKAFESVVGMFVDPVALRLAPGLDDPSATLGIALSRVRERLATAIAHTGIPYLDVVRRCARRSTNGDNPLFSIIATMFDTEDGGSPLVPLDIPLPETSKFALAIEFLPQRDGLMIHALYDADRYRPATIERLLENIRHHLDALADRDTDLSLSSLVADRMAVPTRERFARRFGRIRGDLSSIPN
jgi:phthiocerol/phenolphthiocerol synthesis type-I polyketide synthase E